MQMRRLARVFAARIQSMDVAEARLILNVRLHEWFLDKCDHVTAQNARLASPEARDGLNPPVIVDLLMTSLFHKNNIFERNRETRVNPLL